MKTKNNRISKITDSDFSAFLLYLKEERNYSDKTVLSYGEDVASFLLYLYKKPNHHNIAQFASNSYLPDRY